MESTYKILMMISAVVLILLSVILATNKLPKTPRFRKVRMTQVLLIIAFSSLGIIGKTNRDEIQNQMRLKFARKLQKRNVTEKSRTSYSQKWLSNVN